MTDYDALFEAPAPTDSVFVDKAALDPLAPPAEIVARDAQKRRLATLLNGIHDGSLPPTVSLDGPPGTDTTATTGRAARHAPPGTPSTPSRLGPHGMPLAIQNAAQSITATSSIRLK